MALKRNAINTTKNNNSQFTPLLALVDAVPVLFFGIAALVLGMKVRSAVFFCRCITVLFGRIWQSIVEISDRPHRKRRGVSGDAAEICHAGRLFPDDRGRIHSR